MRVVRFTDPGFADLLQSCAAASSLFDPVVEERTRGIVEEVRSRGDAAVVDLTERFDGPRLTPAQLAITTAEREALLSGAGTR